MKQLSIFILCIIVFVTPILALDCHYTKEVVNSTETKFLPFDKSGNLLKEVIVELPNEFNRPLKIINLNSEKLNLILEIRVIAQYDYIGHPDKFWCGENQVRKIYVNVSGLSTTEVSPPVFGNTAYCNEFMFLNDYTVSYNSNSKVNVKPTLIQHNYTVCLGKDDGLSCAIGSECGSGFCVEGYCSNTNTCYNNDCKCSSNQIQCANNKQCVTKNSIALDTKTLCEKDEECVSGYLDPNTKLCTKSPSQLQEERQKQEEDRLDKIEKQLQDIRDFNKFLIIAIIVLITIIFLGLSVILYLKNRNEKENQITEREKQKTIQKEIEKQKAKQKTILVEISKIVVEIRKIEFNLKEKNEELKKIKQDITLKENELNNVKNDVERKNELKKELDEKLGEEREAENRINELNNKLNDKLNIENELKNKNDFIDKHIIELQESNDKQLELFKNKYFRKYSLRFKNLLEETEDGYLKFKDGKLKGELLHNYFYRTKYPKDFNKNYERHHIDANKFNDELYNLIQLEPNLHRKINHGKIVWGDWDSGIKELRRIGLSEKDFPEEVKNHLGNKNTP